MSRRRTRALAALAATPIAVTGVAITATGSTTGTEPGTIAEIQGRHHVSPVAGEDVSGIEGVVTAVSDKGFWFQSTRPDHDPRTSEGLFVYTGGAPEAEVGHEVRVDGTVEEYRPGGSGGWDNLSTTQLTSPTVTVTGKGRLPRPVVLGKDRVAPQQNVESGDPKSVEYPGARFRPHRDAIDFYESMEGMRVAVRDAHVVGPTASFGEIPVVPPGTRSPRTQSGGARYGGYERPNSARVQIDDQLLPEDSMPQAKVRDRLRGTVAGPLDYSFANYKLLATAAPTVQDGHLQREQAPQASRRDLSVAAFNVENLGPDNPPEKFDRLAGQVVENLRSPDVIAVEEVQDSSGSADDGTVDSTATTDRLIAAIRKAGGPRYEAHWVNPEDNADGGAPGGNIRNVLLHRTDRPLDFVERSSGANDREVAVTTDRRGARLTESPGRVSPAAPAFADSRKPLVGEYRFRGKRVFVSAVHFSSKGGDDPLFGRWQQPVRGSEEERHAQAQEVRSFADDLLAADPDARLVVAGDVNDFEFSKTTDILVGSGSTALTDLPRTLPRRERWTYVYEGNSQVLDHILLSPGLATADHRPWKEQTGNRREHDRGRDWPRPERPFTYDIVHTNSPFPDQDSDHDPQVVHLDIRR